jgi:hypothetical protein
LILESGRCDVGSTKRGAFLREGTGVAVDKRSIESNAGFQQVIVIAGAYLAISWGCTQLMLSQCDMRLVRGLAIIGVAIQVSFWMVLYTQRKNRRKELELYPAGIYDDIPLTITKALSVIALVWISVLCWIAIVSCRAHTVFHPFFLPSNPSCQVPSNTSQPNVHVVVPGRP